MRPEFFGERQLADDAVLDVTTRLWEKGGKQYLGLETTVEALDFWSRPTRLRALVGLDVSHHLRFLEQVRERLWIDIFFAAIIAALFALFAAHRGLAPLRRVTATARGLSAERLGERLAERDAPNPKFATLVIAFNGMLERLESSFRRLSDFSADIAHELRTPVSNLMTQTEVACRIPGVRTSTGTFSPPTWKSTSALHAWSATCCFLPRPKTGICRTRPKRSIWPMRHGH
jgi:two-component system heavy metal sensor histidine kinase CusS